MAIVYGRVQMVMFRDFAQRKARSAGLVGTVRNREDGTVEVVAQGSREKLEQFAALLHKGPLLAQVDHVDISWRMPDAAFDGFKIIY